MPELSNHRWEMFCRYRLTMGAGKAYIKAGFSETNAPQNAYHLVRKHPEVAERIEELKEIARDDSQKEINDYIKRLDDIGFARGDFSGKNKPKDETMIKAMQTAMKAQGIEGDTKLNISGNGYQLIIHEECKEEEEVEGDESD